MEHSFQHEMTISHRDFFRILPKAVKSYPYQQQDNAIKVFLVDDGNKGEINIILSEERLRKIASLSLPVTDVTFRINNVAENTKDEFFKQFERAYQRGGG